MESSNNNNNQMFLCEFKELRNELSAVKKRIIQLEESDEKKEERIKLLESENRELKTQLNISGSKEGGPVLKRKRTDEKDQDNREEPESKAISVSTGKKKTKTDNDDDNDDDDEEAIVLPQRDNGDSFDSLSDDLLHKIVEFDGNCYSKFGSINKRCKNIYDMEEYKLEKKTFVFGYGTLDVMLEYYLQKRREATLNRVVRLNISKAVVIYKRLDAIRWIVQLGDNELLLELCCTAARSGKINILRKVFRKCNLTMLDELLDVEGSLCYQAADNGHLETLKWLRRYGAEWDADTFIAAREEGYDYIVQYLRTQGCPEPPENTDESSYGSDAEDVDN